MKKPQRRETQLPSDDLMNMSLKPGSVNRVLRASGFTFNDTQDWDRVALMLARKVAFWLEGGEEEVDLLDVLEDWESTEPAPNSRERELRSIVIGCAFSILYMNGYVLKKSPPDATLATWEPMAISQRKSA